MTTSFAYLAHGRIALAILAHPFGVLAYLDLAALVLTAAVCAAFRRAVLVKIQAPPLQLMLVLVLAWLAKLAVWYMFR